MKNLLLKTSLAMIALFVFVGGNLFVHAQGMMDYGYAQGGLPFNLSGLFGHYMYGAGILFMIIFILGLAFWIWMLVHAIRHRIEYKPVWILVIWFMNIVGAIVYYFAVKRYCNCKYCQNKKNEDGTPMVCVCDPEAGVCTCGANGAKEQKQ